MTKIVQVDHLFKEYKTVKAVNDLSCTVYQGDVYGFLGQNGAGKSTTIRMLLSLIAPSSGSIRLFGEDIKTHRHDILKQVGAVIEKPDLYKYLTGYENLQLFARISGVKITKKRLDDQLELVGLTDRAHTKVRTYSQGMKQRLGIAVALVHDPQLVILDEPTNGLDPQGIADVRNLILQLSRTYGKTVLVSSHLLNEIEMIANRMLIIDKGKKMVEGSVKELFDPSKIMVEVELVNPGKSRDFFNERPWKEMLQEQVQHRFVLQMNRQQVPQLTAALVNSGAEILSIVPRHSLETYFLSLTTANQHVAAFTN